MQEVIQSILIVFGGVMAKVLIPPILDYLASKTRNRDISDVIVFAKQEVIKATARFGSEDTVRTGAVDSLTKRIQNSTRLGGKFSDDEIRSYIYDALHALDNKGEELNDTNN